MPKDWQALHHTQCDTDLPIKACCHQYHARAEPFCSLPVCSCFARSVEVPHLDKPEVLTQLEGLPAEHFPTRWAQADGWREEPPAEATQAAASEQAAAAARGGAESSAAPGVEPAKVHSVLPFHACHSLLLTEHCHVTKGPFLAIPLLAADSGEKRIFEYIKPFKLILELCAINTK